MKKKVRKAKTAKTAKTTKTTKPATPTKKIEIQKEHPASLNNLEKAVLWHMYLGANSVEKIANGLAIGIDETRQVLEGLENKLMAQRGNWSSQYKLTDTGLKKIEPRKISLDTKLNKWAIKHGQETDLWVLAKNSGDAPLTNVWLRITVPKYVDVSRFSSNHYNEHEKNIIEFPLAQMHPGEAQQVNFKIKGFLTEGALASKYKIDIQALVDERETDKKELNISVAK